MPSLTQFLPVLALSVGLRAAPADESLVHAWQARAMLGAGTWTRLIRIENSAAGSRYPRTLDAVVFELSGVLWFYTDTDGTQSLSRYLNHAEQDKAELGPLLAALDPGFTVWHDAPEGPEPAAFSERLPHGCFIECLALLRTRLAANAATFEPRLLSYYVTTAGGVVGHTVLQFRSQDGWMVIDPHFPKQRRRIRPERASDPRDCANCLRGDVTSARFLLLDGTTSNALARSGGPGKA
jgi:hypothetical protein